MKIMKFMRTEFLLIAVILAFGTIFSLVSNTFLTSDNILGILRKSTELQLLSFGMMGAIIVGGVDLSIGALCSLDTVIIALMNIRLQLPISLSLLIALSISLLIGIANGALIGRLRIAPMLATLGMQAVLLGAGLVITSGSVISGFAESYTFLGNGKLFGVVPCQLILLIAVTVVLCLVYGKFTLGRHIYLVGTNPQVAEFTGISSEKTIIKTYMLSALMAFLAAIVLSSRLASGRPDIANSYLMPAIGACVVGGVSMKGGKGTVLGCVLGVLLFMVISNGLLQFITKNAIFYENVLTGVMILGILSFRAVKDKK